MTVSGHINEGNDLFAEDHPMPAVEEGDIVAIPNVGSYNASMVSIHCLRPEPAWSLHRPRMSDLPVADRWFRVQRVTDEVTLLVEDHLDPFFESNVWHVRGRDRDLSSMPATASATCAQSWRSSSTIATWSRSRRTITSTTSAGWTRSTSGGATRRTRRSFARPTASRCGEPDYRAGLEDEIRWYGYEPPELAITALPWEGFDVAGWRTPAIEPTRLLRDGDVVDLGDRAFEVLHVPGHTAGSLALWDPRARVLFTGDTAALDDPLHAVDEAAFAASLRRLRALPVELVAPATRGRSDAKSCTT